METKFKTGDRVRFIGDESKQYHPPAGTLGTVKSVEEDGFYPLAIDWDGIDPQGHIAPMKYTEVEVVTGAAAKVIKTKPIAPARFILQYDAAGIAFSEPFTTDKLARTRVLELASNPDLLRTSIVLHEIKNTRTVKLGTQVTFVKA